MTAVEERQKFLRKHLKDKVQLYIGEPLLKKKKKSKKENGKPSNFDPAEEFFELLAMHGLHLQWSLNPDMLGKGIRIEE